MDKFTCQRCGGTFDKDWTDEQAMAEYTATFGPSQGRPLSLICDDCHRDFLEWWRTIYQKPRN